jgi:hypothetical protein
MAKKVVLVGHCGADSAYLRIAVSSAAKGSTVVSAHDDASLNQLIEDGVDLVLLNRQLEYGFASEEGVELIRTLRAKHPNLKLMLVTNYDDVQREAIRAGALPLARLWQARAWIAAGEGITARSAPRGRKSPGMNQILFTAETQRREEEKMTR